jgi:hypothetical protein
VATGGWPWLASVADLEASLLQSAPVASWYLVALPAVALVLMPWRPVTRWMGAILLLSVLLMRPSVPPPGEAWLDVMDVGAATAVVVTTTNRVLVFGTGEAFGSRGRRFEERVARRLAGARRNRAVLIIGAMNADRLRAVLAADALLGVGLVARNAGQHGPPGIAECSQRSWMWDNVRFDLSAGATGKSCVLAVRAGDKRVLLTLDAPGTGSADVILLPRNARVDQVGSIGEALRNDGVALASTDLREWQASRWRGIRRELSGKPITLLGTAVEGEMHVEIGRGSRIRIRSSAGIAPGIWSNPPRNHSCADRI